MSSTSSTGVDSENQPSNLSYKAHYIPPKKNVFRLPKLKCFFAVDFAQSI